MAFDKKFSIVVEDLRKSFGKVRAVAGVNFAVRPGTILALLGPNGAGKTTLVRMLTTLLKPDSGHAQVMGYDILRNPQKIRARIGLAGQNVAVDEALTGRENLELVGRLYHLSSGLVHKRAVDLIKKFEMADFADRLVKTYSGGERRRLDLAASLVGSPPVLFLDEPTTGLDPRSRRELWQIIGELRREGNTVLLTTQYMEEADRLADYIIVIDHGRIIEHGTASDLKTRIGAEVLQIKISDPKQVVRAAEEIAPFGSDKPQLDEESGEISMPVDRGPEVLPEIIKRLDGQGVKIVELALHQPSLDDVFLNLTGHKTS